MGGNDEIEQGATLRTWAQRGRRAGTIAISTSTALAVVGGSLVAVTVPAGAATLTVTTTADSGAGSLRQVLDDAIDGDVITFDLPAGSTITLEGSALTVDANVLIDGTTATDLTVDAGGGSGAFYLYPDALAATGTITISGLTITGGVHNGPGGGISSVGDGHVVLDGVEVVGNTAVSEPGGGIDVRGGTLSITDSVVSGNTSDGPGGGIHARYHFILEPYERAGLYGVSITDTTISGNTTNGVEGDGGGVFVADVDGEVSITGSSITDNNTLGSDSLGGGAALQSIRGDVNVSDSTFSGNGTDQVGGGLQIADISGNVSVTDARISGNTAGEAGGGLSVNFVGSSERKAVYYDDGNVTIDRTTISANDAPAGGGAAIVDIDGQTTITSSTISGNTATGGETEEIPAIYGGMAGGLFLGYAEAHILDSTIQGNDAYAGGGLAILDPSFGAPDLQIEGQGGPSGVTVERSTISGNRAVMGAGVFHASKYLELINSTVSGNVASEVGGGILSIGGFDDGPKYTTFLRHSTIVGNSAAVGGGLALGTRFLAPAQVALKRVVEPGGEYYYGSALVDHTIIGDNTATGSVEQETPAGYGNDLMGAVVARYSLIEDSEGDESLIIDVEGNIFEQDPELGALQGNGGPTATHLPNAGSPVVDAGDEEIEEAPETDQRGLDRIQGARIDIGAVEGFGTGTVVKVVATTDIAVEGGEPGVFTFTRTGSTASALTIGYSVSGTASADDYEPLGTVMFPAGQASVTKQVVAVADELEEPDETVIVTLLDGDGYTVATPIADTVTIVDEASEGPAGCELAPEDGFTDVPDTNVHEAAIDCLAWLGITIGGPEGLDDAEYGPSLEVTRGQMATFLMRLITEAGIELPAEPEDAFDDDDGTTHEDAINKLVAAGIIEGFDDGTYGEGLPVRRDQMASFLLRTYELITGDTLPPGEDAFDDDEPGNVHEAAINALAAAGVILGTGVEGEYDPSGNVRRDQMASFLIRLVELLSSEGHFEFPETPEG